MIPLTAAEIRRPFNPHTHITGPQAFHEQWTNWSRYRRSAARKSNCARPLRSLKAAVQYQHRSIIVPVMPRHRPAH